jgi:hypothetical protein
MSTNIQPREADFDRVVDQALREAHERLEVLRKPLQEANRCVTALQRQAPPAGSHHDARR